MALGNYLNGTSARGGAHGFKFDGFERIVDCRSTINPKRNLLMFILELYENSKHQELFKGTEDLTDYETAMKIPINQLDADLSDIKKGVKAIDQAMQSQTDNPIDKIKETFIEIYSDLNKIISDFEEKIKKINEEFKSTVAFFAEDPKEPSDKIGKKFYQMFNFCVNNKKELEKLRLFQRKEKEKEEKKKELEAKKKEMLNKGTIVSKVASPSKRGRLNIIINLYKFFKKSNRWNKS